MKHDKTPTTPMNAALIKASTKHKQVIRNLFQLYTYDFSEFLPLDVGDDGLFAPYPHLDVYWQEAQNRFPYLILKDGKYAGFVLVRFMETADRNYFSIAEFFVLKKYRRAGIGKDIAIQVFDLHRGQWEVYQQVANKPAQLFWNKVIASHTNGRFTDRTENGKRIQDFEN